MSHPASRCGAQRDSVAGPLDGVACEARLLHDRPTAGGPPPPDKPGEDFTRAAADLAGLAGLMFGWSPDAFWQATPAELAALVRAARGGGDGAPAAPVDLDALMERFPDD